MNNTKNLDDPIPQAEVGGGGRIDPHEGLQRPGYMIRDFALTTIGGDRIRISDYRGRANLLLFFLGSSPNWSLVHEMAKRIQEFTEQEAVVVVVVPRLLGDRELQKTWAESSPILMDEDASLHRLFGAIDQQGVPSSVVYITDKFGEIVSLHPVLDGRELPSIDEMLKTLEFINHKCPECEPPEWPR